MQEPRDKFLERESEHEWHPRAIYLDLDKQFGAVSTETLESIASLLETSSELKDIEYAASALLEAVVFAPNRSIDTVDGDLDAVDYAEDLLKKAAYGHWSNLEQNATIDPTDALRAETQLAFIEMYRDIVCGEVTEQTRAETFATLSRVGRQANSYLEQADSTHVAGLVGETTALMGGLTDPNMILLPSTPREDSGEYGDNAITHDFNHITLGEEGRVGQVTRSVGIEFKRLANDFDRARAERRYDRNRIVLIHAADIGIHRMSIQKIYSNFELTPKAVRDLTPVREGINRHVSEAMKQWDIQAANKPNTYTHDRQILPKKTA